MERVDVRMQHSIHLHNHMKVVRYVQEDIADVVVQLMHLSGKAA